MTRTRFYTWTGTPTDGERTVIGDAWVVSDELKYDKEAAPIVLDMRARHAAETPKEFVQNLPQYVHNAPYLWAESVRPNKENAR